jgi:phosphatidylglycerophosphatase A
MSQSKSRRWIATLLGAGMLPGAPGTWGSAVTCVLLFFALNNTATPLPVLAAGLAVFSVLSVGLGEFSVVDFGSADPPSFVLDEAAGICLTMMWLPMTHGLVVTLIAAFGAFRLFDVTKPPPCRQLEKLPAGWGILMDDLAAAIYANLLCQIILRLV